MKRSKPIDEPAGWLSAGGEESDIVLSSRVRLARNLSGYHFLSRVSPTQQKEVAARLREAILAADLADDLRYYAVEELGDTEREVLVERHLISKELAHGEGPRGVAIGRDETLSLMVNEEDHLRLQGLHAGFALDEVWALLRETDDKLAARLPYAFSAEFGYLTACPTNVGTGLRASVMMHLPGMVMSRRLEKVFNAVSKLNLAVRGLYGEGTQATGDLFQISNQRTLGKSEEEILNNLAAVVPQVTEYERRVRQAIVKQDKVLLEDRAWRAYGLLSSARSVSSEEALYLLSSVRLGIHLGLLDQLDIATVNRLQILTQPAHIQTLQGKKTSAEERNVFRANLIRSALTARKPGKEA